MIKPLYSRARIIALTLLIAMILINNNIASCSDVYEGDPNLCVLPTAEPYGSSKYMLGLGETPSHFALSPDIAIELHALTFLLIPNFSIRGALYRGNRLSIGFKLSITYHTIISKWANSMGEGIQDAFSSTSDTLEKVEVIYTIQPGLWLVGDYEVAEGLRMHVGTKCYYHIVKYTKYLQYEMNSTNRVIEQVLYRSTQGDLNVMPAVGLCYSFGEGKIFLECHKIIKYAVNHPYEENFHFLFDVPSAVVMGFCISFGSFSLKMGISQPFSDDSNNFSLGMGIRLGS